MRHLQVSKRFGSVAVLVIGAAAAMPAGAWESSDGTLELRGFLDNTTHERAHGQGLVKQRFRGQLEFSKDLEPMGPFSELSLHGIGRITYDGVYDLNQNDWGDEAGGGVKGQSSGIQIPGLTGAQGLRTPWGESPVTDGPPATLLLPGGGSFGFNNTDPTAPLYNPNEGLRKVGGILGRSNNKGGFGGGLEFFAPVRPCGTRFDGVNRSDDRGCIKDYLDFDEDDLRFPEFRDDHRWLRELYVDATVPFANGNELNFRIGRQQVVWGRTDLFRVLDQINPIDFSIQNIYEEFEDARIPLGIFSVEYRMGATDIFDDINVQFIWNFENFQPHVLGQAGQPYSILGAGDLFRALNNCWHNGCTISNFAGGLSPAGNLATDFPAHVVGIRQANLPDGNDQFGLRLEGVFKSVGFSFNALYFYSQLPSLQGHKFGTVNPFIGPGFPAAALGPFLPELGGQEFARDFLPAFDIEFPRILLLGASADYYVDQVGSIPLKSTFRIEFAHTNGEEFANTANRRLFSDSRVIRWVVGWDRSTFFRFLNPNRSFLLSAQMFGQHILDHEHFGTGFGSIGMPDFKEDFIFTFLVQGNYMNDRLTPQVIMAYNVRPQAYVVSPSINWLISDNWSVNFAANLKFGTSRHVVDDGRSSNPYPPFTCNALSNPCPVPNSSTGLPSGYEPLGRFRSGPIGWAQAEDELQLNVRYRF